MGATASRRRQSESPSKLFAPLVNVPHAQRQELYDSAAELPAGAHLRRNPATGSVVLIAPERLARLRSDPFRLSQAGLHDFPVFDEEGGRAWRDAHPQTFQALLDLAQRIKKPTPVAALQDACLLLHPHDDSVATAGLPMHERTLRTLRPDLMCQ
jgi:hypothetical protein